MKKNLIFFLTLIPLLAFGEGGPVTSNRYNDSLIGSGSSDLTGPAGPAGPTGPTGPAGTFSSSYGQLSFSSSQSISLNSANTWVAIPFNAFTLSHNVDGSTSSPATITVVDAGVYQINVSLYFSSEDSFEGTFTQATYTLGISTDTGTPVAFAAVYVGEAGYFSLNYSGLVELSASDTLQFYMKASAVGGDFIFDNIVTMLNGNASIMQIAE